MEKNNTIEIILEKTLLSHIIRSYVDLKHKNGNVFLGKCPFHMEKTPSFHVDDQKGLYHCFGCKASGNAITFLSAMEHTSKKDAVEKLAQLAGIELNAQTSQKYQKEKILKNSLKKINNFSAQQWNHYLLTHPESPGMMYLTKRGFSLKTIKEFQLGYAPKEFSYLSSRILSLGTSTQDLIQSSLFFESKDGTTPIKDRFIDRIMFPINDPKGEPIAFGSRVLDQSLPKYINTNETSLFKKKETLYGFDKAKNSIIKEKNIYLVEGYFDVLAMHQFELINTVATLGTAFGESHLKAISPMVEQITFLFDGDTAGLKAAERSVKLCLQTGVVPIVVLFPENIDPCDYLFSFGEDSLKDLIKRESYAWSSFFLKPIKEEQNALKQRKLIQAIIDFLKTIDPLLTNEFMEHLSQALEISKSSLEEYFLQEKSENSELFKAYLPKKKKPPKSVANTITPKNQQPIIKQRAEWTIVKLFLYYHPLYKSYKEHIGPSFFTMKDTQEIFVWISENEGYFDNDPSLNRETILEKLPSHLFEAINKHDTFNVGEDYKPSKLLEDTLDLYKLLHIKENIKEINTLIKEAEQEEDLKEVDRLMNMIKTLKKDELQLKKQRGFNNAS